MDKSLSMAWWRWHISVSQLCCCWSMAVCFLSSIYYCLRVFCCAAASKEESQFAKTFWRGKMTFLAVSSQVMKHGSTSTTPKRSGKVHNGILPIPHDQKLRQSKSKVETMLLTSLIWEGLFITNLYQLDKQSTKFTIWKYWKGCVKKLDRNDPKYLPSTHGSCSTTMYLLTRHCLWGSVWLLNK